MPNAILCALRNDKSNRGGSLRYLPGLGILGMGNAGRRGSGDWEGMGIGTRGRGLDEWYLSTLLADRTKRLY